MKDCEVDQTGVQSPRLVPVGDSDICDTWEKRALLEVLRKQSPRMSGYEGRWMWVRDFVGTPMVTVVSPQRTAVTELLS
jgi:hypothetical protein